MTRQIKFRGLRTDGEGWVYGDLKRVSDFRRGGSWYYIYVDGKDIDEDGEEIQIEPYSLGQFTGLHDNNGSEIYEGDVLQYNHGSNESYVVEYVIKGFNQSFGHGLVGVRTICGFDFDPYHNLPERCQVIGNIHTNEKMVGNG